MDDILARRETARAPRRVSAAAEAGGANVSPQDGEETVIELTDSPDRPSAAAARMERRNSAPQAAYKRHMPMEPLKLPIPRKTKENRALFQYVSTESREYEDMMTILSSSYLDTSSAGCFTYSKPRLVHSEPQEKEFVEKRKEMKADGRTDKELEESYCFLMADADKLPLLCEKGLHVGQSWITVLGNPSKGVHLSRYSDLLQTNPITPGVMGEIIIFKVMKGKVKSIYENMKNLLDPTPRFDSHISKNSSKVTSLTSYRAFELTQQYFYEYLFDELRQRPRQVCPYAVVSFQFKGKDSTLPSKPLAPIRLNSQSVEGSKERSQFTVWTGDLVKGERVLFQISLRSYSPPFLPHRLPEKLEIGQVMRFDQLTKLLPSDLLSYNLYNSSKEVVKSGHCCSLLEVTDRSRSWTSVTRLLQELETKRVVLVTPLPDRGFLFLISSVQMATPSERGESWKRCLQALFVFPESRDLAKSTLRRASSSHNASESVMPRLSQFIPAFHHALVKARADPPAKLSAGVERQAREYLIDLNDSKVQKYPMGEYESKQDEQGKPFPTPKHHWVIIDGYLRSYLYSPEVYLLSVARAKQMVEAHCGPEEPREVKLRKSCGGQRESAGKEATSKARDRQAIRQKMQQLVDMLMTNKRNVENEMRREEGGGVVKVPGRKRKLEQETAERTLKFLKASLEPGRHSKVPVDGSQAPASAVSLASVIGLVGLTDADLREDGSELAATLTSLITDLIQAARGTANQSLCEVQEEGPRDSCPFDRLATKLGLPTNCDIDLRKQEELEEQTAGSVSSLEGFSPGSHSGEMNHHAAAGRGGGLSRRAGYEEEEEEAEIPWEIPWVLIPITGVCSQRYTQRERNIPQDPRFQHLTTATSITTTTKPPRNSPTPSPEPSPPQSLSQCPSPSPSPPPSPSQCSSPEPSLPPSPSQCPSPEPSPPPSPSQCPSPQPSPPPFPSQRFNPLLGRPPFSSRCQSVEPNEFSPLNKDHGGANEDRLATTASRESTGVSKKREKKPQGKEKKNEEPSISASIQPFIHPAREGRMSPSPLPMEREKEDEEGETREVKETEVELLVQKKETQPVERSLKPYDEEEEVMEIIHMVASDEEQNREVKEPVGGSLLSQSISLPPSRLDSVVDKNLGDFSSEMQLLLQEQSVHYSFPQSPHSTSNTETATTQHTLPHSAISQFSQYVSFYNPCPPVQDYISSLQDSIDSMLTEFDDSWPSHKPGTSRTDVDAALANRVSDFVSSIRAANAKTGEDDDELTAADVGTPVSQNHALHRGSEMWQSLTITKQFTDATNDRDPPTSHVTLSVTTCASDSVYNPTNTSVLIPPNKSPQSHWKPQQSHALEINRTAAHNIRQTQDNGTTRTVHFTPGVEGGSSFASANFEVTLSGLSGVSQPSTDPSHPSEPVSSETSASVPVPATDPASPASALSSLISRLQPEVFNNLVEIFKDVKRNSLQFYLHSIESGDQVHEEVKEYMLKQGNAEKSPVAFLNQQNSADRLLVIIKNKDITGHIHKIPSLVSLKQQASVVFVGIDSLDDIRNNSYNELFVSGGCIVSDEFILTPDYTTREQLVAVLMLLEKHSSPESIWRWKVHWKTHKKLKEQARFRRDAANLLDVLSDYQKRQVVEFLPYHHCDMINHQGPHLDCLMELQAQYTQYRHTVFLTEHHSEKSAVYSSNGIIVARTEDLLHNFNSLVGYHDIKDRQPITDDMLAPKGLGRQLSHSDFVSGSERSSSIFPEHIDPLSSCDQPQHLLQQSGSTLPTLSHLSDQLVPDASCKEGVPHHTDTDFEVLRQAISQFRAERQAQLQQQLDSQAEFNFNSPKSFLPDVIHTDSGYTTSLLAQAGPAELENITSDRKAVAATLEMIHSELQQEPSEEERRKDGAETPTKGQRTGGGEGGDQRDGTPVRVVGLLGGNRDLSNSDTSTPSPSQSTAAVTGPSTQTDSTNDWRETASEQGEPLFPEAAEPATAAFSSTTACPIEGDRLRDTQLVQEQPIRGEGAPTGNSTASGTKTITRGDDGPNIDSPFQVHLPPSVCERKWNFDNYVPPTSTALTENKGEDSNLETQGTARQGPAKNYAQRLQLYNHHGEKFSYRQLLNPMVWKDISYARPGWTPDHTPYVKPGNWYLELKANSTVVFTGMAPPNRKHRRRMACGVTCYNHHEGPWCEVQSQSGARICILAIPPPVAWTSH